MSKPIQTAIKKNVPRTHRYEAIDSLARSNETTNLGIIVRMGGLRGEFRRYALDALAECNATEKLQELADDSSVDPSLREKARRLA